MINGQGAQREQDATIVGKVFCAITNPQEVVAQQEPDSASGALVYGGGGRAVQRGGCAGAGAIEVNIQIQMIYLHEQRLRVSVSGCGSTVFGPSLLRGAAR